MRRMILNLCSWHWVIDTTKWWDSVSASWCDPHS